MIASFGGQTVTFVSVTKSGTPDADGLQAKSTSTTNVSGCHFRPASSKEAPATETNVASTFWKLTAPPVAAVLAAKPTDKLTYGGLTFLVEGPVQPKYDGAEVHHVTIMCKRQEG